MHSICAIRHPRSETDHYSMDDSLGRCCCCRPNDSVQEHIQGQSVQAARAKTATTCVVPGDRPGTTGLLMCWGRWRLIASRRQNERDLLIVRKHIYLAGRSAPPSNRRAELLLHDTYFLTMGGGRGQFATSGKLRSNLHCWCTEIKPDHVPPSVTCLGQSSDAVFCCWVWDARTCQSVLELQDLSHS